MEDVRKFLDRDPYRFVMRVLMTKWKPMILSAIYFEGGTARYNQFKKGLPISEKVLTENLRELESDGLLVRKVYAEVPPRVEYTLTETGNSAVKLLFQIYSWGYNEMVSRGMEIDKRGAMYHGLMEPDEEIMKMPMQDYLEMLQSEETD